MGRIFKFLGAVFFGLTLSFVLSTSGIAEDISSAEPSPVKAKVFFVTPLDGAKVRCPVKVRMGVEGKKLAKLGSRSEQEGHHHILIDLSSTPAGRIIPTDAKHLHFGQGQSEALLELAPGKHRLTLQFGDGLDRSFGPDLSSTIHIEVLPK